MIAGLYDEHMFSFVRKSNSSKVAAPFCFPSSNESSCCLCPYQHSMLLGWDYGLHSNMLELPIRHQ